MSSSAASNQESFDQVSFADNPEPRCACLLLVDTSISMEGLKIAQLNAGLQTFRDELMSDDLAVKRVETAVVRFSPVEIVQPFTHPAQMNVAPLPADGSGTPMGKAIQTGIGLLQERRELYKQLGIPYYRPWLILLTDGEPTDDVRRAAAAIRAGEEKKQFAFFAIGVDTADMDLLARISVREPLRLKGHRFREFFLWLSNSMKTVSRSVPGDRLALPPPSGWAEL